MHSRSKTALLICPPFEPASYLSTYPSLPVLAASLMAHGVRAIQLDANNAMLRWYLKSKYFRLHIEEARRSVLKYRKARQQIKGEQSKFYGSGKLLSWNRQLLASNIQKHRDAVDQIFRYLRNAEPCLKPNSVIDEEIVSPAGPYGIITKFYETYFRRRNLSMPLFVGISIPMPRQVVPAILLAVWIRQNLWKDVRIIWGGPAISLVDRGTLFNLMKMSGVDGTVVGEGEESIVQIADQIICGIWNGSRIANLNFVENNTLRQSSLKPRRSIDDYPAPLYDKRVVGRSGNHVFTVVTGRGCYWGRCSYCNFQSLYRRIQTKSAEAICADISELIHRYRAKKFLLSCDTVEPAHVRRMCELFLERKLKIVWGCFLRVDNDYSGDDFCVMKKAGCRQVVIGMESLDDISLKLMNKGYTSKEATSFLRKLLASGLGARVDMIIDLPGTTYKSARRQFMKLKKILSEAARNGVVCKAGRHRFMCLGNSSVGKNPHRYGIDVKHSSRGCNLAQLTGIPYSDSKGMTEDEKRRIEGLYISFNERLQLGKV